MKSTFVETKEGAINAFLQTFKGAGDNSQTEVTNYAHVLLPLEKTVKQLRLERWAGSAEVVGGSLRSPIHRRDVKSHPWGCDPLLT